MCWGDINAGKVPLVPDATHLAHRPHHHSEVTKENAGEGLGQARSPIKQTMRLL